MLEILIRGFLYRNFKSYQLSYSSYVQEFENTDERNYLGVEM